MQIETKIILVFAAILIFVLSIGTGGLSFKEAKSKADRNLSSLNWEQITKLTKAKSKIAEVAFPACAKTTTAPTDFTIVMEIKSDGYIRRMWRMGDSRFVLCLQTFMQENFNFRPFSQPFFISIEYASASLQTHADHQSIRHAILKA